MIENQKQILKLRGKTAIFIDWANVHGWEEKLKWEVDLAKLYRYLLPSYAITFLISILIYLFI